MCFVVFRVYQSTGAEYGVNWVGLFLITSLLFTTNCFSNEFCVLANHD